MHLLLLTALLALPAVASANQNIYFTSPSGNVFCMGDSRHEYGNDGWWGVTCELSEHKANILPPQKRPSRQECPMSWGGSFSLRQTGRATIDCRGDTNRISNAPALAYGETISGKGWQCNSRQDGILCKNSSGHGFHLSRIRQQLF